MATSKQESVANVLKVTAAVAELAFATSLPGSALLLTKKVKNSRGETVDVEKDSTDYEKDLEKVDFLSEVTKKKAQVAQELAIASRITTAETVEIEEYFDKKGEGKAAVTYENGIDINANGQNVSKRVYRFKGFNNNTDGLADLLKSILPSDTKEDE